jgi:hypothetical protein
MMAGLVVVGSILLLCIVMVAALAMVSTEDGGNVENPEAFAVLPVPEDTPHVRAFLEFYASQVSWMDASVLRCVILVGNAQTQGLCEELAQNHACYQAMTLTEVQALTAQRCAASKDP